MINQLFGQKGRTAPSPSRRGVHGLYYQNEINHCPGCGRTHWVIGRFSAECAFCATALSLCETATLGVGTYVCRGRTQAAGGCDVS